MRISRRTLLGSAGYAALATTLPRPSRADTQDAATLAWPSDVPSWDPNQRFAPDAQSIFKMVFDAPLSQDQHLKLIPWALTKWELAPDARSLTAELRDDIVFQNGDKLTSADFRYTFFERVKSGAAIDTASAWRKVADIETPTPTRVVMHFSSVAPTAPQWLGFLGSFIVPKAYFEKVGFDGFHAKPIGSGPYRVAEYEMNSRMTLERNDNYWGPKPALRRITINVLKDPATRVAAVQSGQADLTISVPVIETQRLGRMPGLAAELNPITRIIMLLTRSDLAFADENLRLAAHHAIDKVALSKAFYGGAAKPLSVLATPGSPGYRDDYTFTYDPDLAKQLLAKSGYGPDKPARFTFACTNGEFPSDYDIGRALIQMWKKVGIDATLQVIEYSQYFDLKRAGKLPEVTINSWENATGDPEIFIGYTLNPQMPFSTWRDMQLGQKVIDQFNVPQYGARIAGWRDIEVEASEVGAVIPLMQAIRTVVHNSKLAYPVYDNGWILGQEMRWT